MKQQSSNWRTLLHRWISGEADRTDERSLEALAEDDPFLADALEGYRSVPEADHARSVTRLKAILRKRNEKKDRAIVFYLKRIAAVGVVVIGAWLMFHAFDNANEKAMAFDERAEAARENKAASVVTDSVIGSKNNVEMFASKTKEGEEKAAGYVQLKDAIADTEKNAPPPVRILPPPSDKNNELANQNTTSVGSLSAEKKAKADPGLKANDKLAVVPQDTDAKKYVQADRIVPLTNGAKVEASQPKPAPTAKRAQAPAPEVVASEPAPTFDVVDDTEKEMAEEGIQSIAPFVLIGKVTDARGEPLIGATVLIKNTSQGAVTDIDGLFSIESPIEKPMLLVSYTGFQGYEVKAENGQFLNVQLEDGAEQLSEVMVTKRDYGIFKKKNNAVNEIIFEPKGGFKKFEKYIKENFRMPQPAIDSGIKGQVEIDFTIDASGKPTDFTTIRSLGHGCEEEAIRLLQEGTKWNGQPGTRHSYTFEF